MLLTGTGTGTRTMVTAETTAIGTIGLSTEGWCLIEQECSMYLLLGVGAAHLDGNTATTTTTTTTSTTTIVIVMSIVIIVIAIVSDGGEGG